METAVLDQLSVNGFKANTRHVLLALCAIGLLAGCNGSGTNGSSDNSDNDAQEGALAAVSYAAKGPYQEGSVVRFYELNPDNGVRLGAAVAEAVIGELGVYALPDMANRWVEAEVGGDFFNEYDSSFTDDGGLTTTAIFDLEGSRDGRNINLFTHFAAARAHQLLGEGTADNLEAAYSRAASDLQADFNMNHPPEELHPFYSAALPRTRLDDYSALLIASALVSKEIENQTQFSDLVNDYGRFRTDSRNENFEQLAEAFRESGAIYINRALRGLKALQEENGSPDNDRLSLLWTLSGCASAQAFNADPVVCVDDLRTTYSFDIPAGEGKHYEELFYYPSQAGMWALEVAHDDACLTSWSTRTLRGSAIDSSPLFNTRVLQRLLARERLNPGMYSLRVTINRDECSATQTDLTFRRVAEGRDHVDQRGNVFLENTVTHPGIVGAFSNTVGSFERSSNRSYYYFVAPTNASTYRIELDYAASSSSAMGTHIEYLSVSGFSEGDFNSHPSDIVDSVSGENQIREFEAIAGTTYRIEVRNTSPTTINVNNSTSYSRFPFELTLTRQ